MKHCKKLTLLLIAALLLAAALMTGCTSRTPAQDAPADTKKEGIYVRLERDDAYAVYLNSDSFTKVCENADGTPLKSGEVPGHLAARRYRRRRGCRFRLAFRIAVFLLPTTRRAEFDLVQYDDHCALFLVCYAVFPDILVQPAENIDE